MNMHRNDDDITSSSSSSSEDNDEEEKVHMVVPDDMSLVKSSLIGNDKDNSNNENDKSQHKDDSNNNNNRKTENNINGDEYESQDEWVKHRKHILILSSAGKPIYSRHGDESNYSSLFGLLQAILSRMNESLQVVRSGTGHVIVFVVKGPIYLVAISRTAEPVSYLQKQLEFVYQHLLFHFTRTALIETFKRKPGYDIRGLMGGMQSEMKGIIKMAHYTTNILLNGVPSLKLPQDKRTTAIHTMASLKQSKTLYALLVADSKLVCSVSPRRHPLTTTDTLLLINFVANAKQLKTQETWSPICMPGFNNTGFLHLYAAYISESACFLLVSADETLDQFHYSSKCKEKLKVDLGEAGVIAAIEASVSEPNMVPASCEAAAAIHVLVKSTKIDQYAESSIAIHAPLHQGRSALKRLYRRYAHCQETFKGEDSYKTVWHVGTSEAILISLWPHYEIYASFHSFMKATEAMSCCERFYHWVKREKHSLFALKHGTW